MNFTVGDAVAWVILHRKNNAFKGYSPEKIALQIVHCEKQNGFAYSLDNTGHLNGIVCCGIIDANTVQCYDVLTTDKGVIKKLMGIFMDRFPHHKIIGKVRSRKRVFHNPLKLTKRL